MADAISAGRVVRVTGPVVDAEFPPGELPEILHALEIDFEVDGDRQDGGVRDRSAPGQLQGAGDRHALHRRVGEGDRGTQHRSAHHGPGGTQHAGSHLQRLGGSAGCAVGLLGIRRVLAHSPPAAQLRGRGAAEHHLRDRHQGHRPPGALHPGWKGRDVRRCGHRKDGDHPGDDQPGGHPARRRLGVRRGGGSGPARGTTCSRR